jgi:ABC-type Mn2+/Zn2+ transport system ATPase subunit
MASPAISNDVAARGLVIGYDGKPVVENVTFELKEGQAIALIGTNGSGKSTLLKTIVGLLPPLYGELSVFGGKPGENPKRIAYLGQFHASGFVLPLRAIDVVRMGRYPRLGLLGRMTAEDHDIVRQAMAAMGVEKLADSPLRALSTAPTSWSWTSRPPASTWGAGSVISRRSRTSFAAVRLSWWPPMTSRTKPPCATR